jgi:hypothetical protein
MSGIASLVSGSVDYFHIGGGKPEILIIVRTDDMEEKLSDRLTEESGESGDSADDADSLNVENTERDGYVTSINFRLSEIQEHEDDSENSSEEDYKEDIPNIETSPGDQLSPDVTEAPTTPKPHLEKPLMDFTKEIDNEKPQITSSDEKINEKERA